MSGNLFEDRNWLLLPNYLSNDNENKTESEPKNTASVTSPQLKKRNSRQMTKKNAVGDHIALFANPRRKRKRTSHSSRRHCQKYKNLRPKDPILLNLNITKTKQQWEAEMERLNSKYNLDYFSDSELDSRVTRRGTVSL